MWAPSRGKATLDIARPWLLRASCGIGLRRLRQASGVFYGAARISQQEILLRAP